MKTRHWFSILSAIAGSLCAVVPAGANTLNVRSNGVDSSSCGRESPCRSISQAIANATSGDTIYVGPGTYGDINGDNFTGPGDEKPDPNAGYRTNLGPSSPGCIVCITKPVHIYSLQGAATTVIASDPNSPYGSTVMIESDGVDFGAQGQGFTLTGGSNNGVTIMPATATVLKNISIVGNIDQGDNNGFAFYGYPNLSLCPPGDVCRSFTARVLLANNQAINNTSHGLIILLNYCGYYSSSCGSFTVKENFAFGAGTGVAVIPSSEEEDKGGLITAGEVALVSNVAVGGGVGFSANLSGSLYGNTALNNSQAGFELTPLGGTAFERNSAIGNGGPGVIINYVVGYPPDYILQATKATFAPFTDNNFIGNDRKRPASLGSSAHCGVLTGIFAGYPVSPPPQPIQLAAADNYWGSAAGPSSTGPADAVGGACQQNNTTTIATSSSSKPFPVTSFP